MNLEGGRGRRGRNRTCNPRIRNPMLYPFELRALNQKFTIGARSGREALGGHARSFPDVSI
jgi:hypothetical protein